MVVKTRCISRGIQLNSVRRDAPARIETALESEEEGNMFGRMSLLERNKLSSSDAVS